MGRKLSSVDIAIIVFGTILIVLTLSLMGVSGVIMSQITVPLFPILQLCLGGWYLLTAALAIASGGTGHKGPYISVIVLSVLAVLLALGVGTFSVIGLVGNEFVTAEANVESSDISDISSDIGFDGSDLVPTYHHHSEQHLSNAVTELIGLPIATLVINFLNFVFMIVVSSLACCGACCNTPSEQPYRTFGAPAGIVTTSGGYTVAPPTYHAFPPTQGLANPNYSSEVAMHSYKQ